MSQGAMLKKPLYSLTDLQSDALLQRRVPRSMATPGQLLRSTLLQAVDGFNLQAVYPAHCLLDLQKLNAGGTDWRARSPDYRENLLRDLKIKSLPALPGMLPMPLCVDLRYLEGDWVFVESSDPEKLLRFTRDEYVQLIAASQAEEDEFSVPLTEARPNLDHPHRDEKEIRFAVEAITQQRVRARLSESIEIAPLPLSSQRLLALKSKEDVSGTELAQVIEMDPSLASQVISWANSPYYGAPGSIRSIQDAVIRVLGFDLTMNLALGLALSRQIRLPKDGVHGHRHFWRDALLRALLVEKLVKKMPPLSRPYTGLAYLGGLLHNFGYLVLAEVFPPYFSLYCRNQEANPHVPPMYLERFLFGITREQIASYLFTTWGLPDEMCIAVRQQHNPHYTGPHFKYANLLYLADQYLQPQWEQGLSRIPSAVYDRLQIAPEDALSVRKELEDLPGEQMEELVRLLEHSGKR
ncbi:HDOD domain-containing protein [Marinospirillum alkaliphilum]|uniref:HD-like signal output (HDOD) domain, no enzymatic activity n=1 Tax=Marinospirillum alkaliphilum DSM 21637 TaxID=1122209 RepID=A0A1K1Z7V7_9GAMM|nr:HDOD domain-containing protein [Marinospirillum alkaliphilum]SFX69764.1 HD-like signal output (HDOD) domain, no enzymatic activity [Marinospirillum alkaliphilum DSM 21637]